MNGCIKSFDFEIEEAPKLEVQVEEYNLDCSIESLEILPDVVQSAGEVNF